LAEALNAHAASGVKRESVASAVRNLFLSLKGVGSFVFVVV
jgi:hypothetical protein